MPGVLFSLVQGANPEAPERKGLSHGGKAPVESGKGGPGRAGPWELQLAQKPFRPGLLGPRRRCRPRRRRPLPPPPAFTFTFSCFPFSCFFLAP